MPVAIIGAGEIGGALAHRLATRDRVRRIRLIDPFRTAAVGKALDIQQAAPIAPFAARVTGSNSLDDAIGCSIVALADSAEPGKGEWQGEAGLALLRQVALSHRDAVILLPGAFQAPLMERGISELRLDATRLVGSAPGALVSAVRALVALELDAATADVALTVLGLPPDRLVVGWHEGTIVGSPLEDALAPPARLRIEARLRFLWPPGPQALASAAALACEAVLEGSRRSYACFTALDRPIGGAGRVAACPVVLGPRGVASVVQPRLSVREQVQLGGAFGA
jgi:malate dehydrogenase